MKISQYRKAEKPGLVQGYFSIIYEDKYGTRFENDLQLLMKNGHRWVAFYHKGIKNDDKVTYYPLAGYLMRSSQDAFSRDVIAAIDKYFNQSNPVVNLGHSEVPAPLAYKDNDEYDEWEGKK